SRDPRYIPPGWSYWAAAIQPSAKYVNFKLNVGGVRKHVPRRYKTNVFNQMAVNFVDRRATSETPFFLWLSHIAPHSGGPEERDDPSALGLVRHNHTPAVSAKYRNAYNHMRLPQPPGFNEANVKDKPRYVRNKHRLGPKAMSAIEETIQQRREALLSVDDGVAAILNALQRNGELGRTLVIFTSDNGMMNGQHRLRNKYYPYTPSIRVPLIIRGPGVPTGARRSQPVGTIDLAPTITDAAGITPSAVVDGRSLLPLASSGAVGTHRTMLLELGQAPHGPNTWPTAFYTGVRTQRWVYLEYGTGERELYNQARDPHQLRSKHADPDLRDVERQLARALDRLRDCGGRSCR
ncbi:MAG: sulfatase-like hydrolase/transferase, partial [Actinomycetota bacterium]|nr:sulfatase-like hydrolase/transferase [Actinomycetota bacterium]